MRDRAGIMPSPRPGVDALRNHLNLNHDNLEPQLIHFFWISIIWIGGSIVNTVPLKCLICKSL